MNLPLENASADDPGMVDNPYDGVGQEATGSRFIGRADQVRQVQQVWRRPGRPSNLRVLGHHRVGKTSLVRRALSASASLRRDLLMLWLNVGDHVSGSDLFRSMSRQAVEGIRDSAQVPPELVGNLCAIDAAVQATSNWYDLSEALKKFFVTLSQAGCSALAVLDEFDRAATVFTTLAEFQTLRTLASEPQYSFSLITISRQHIESIEIDAMGGSILGGVVTVPHYVSMFTDAETDLLLARGAAAGVGLASVRAEIIQRAGRHPFLLELLCHRLVDQYHATGNLDVAAAYDAEIHAFDTQFTQLVNNINAETDGKGLTLLKQIAAGRAPESPSSNLQRLRLMGVVSDDTRLFSAEFGRYVLMTDA